MTELSFNEYLDLVNKQAKEKLTRNENKFFDVLKLMKENAKEAEQKITTASIKQRLYLPIKYKKEPFVQVIQACCDDYSLAMEDMKDPEKYAAILSILNEKLAKDGDEFAMNTPENKMLGLANRYALSARECQYLEKWSLFAFYMRSLAYFIPQLIHKANLKEEKILDKIEAKLNLIKTESSIDPQIRIKKLTKDNDLEGMIPLLYMASRGGKDEKIIYRSKNSPKDYSIIDFTQGSSRANDSAQGDLELQKIFDKYHSPKALKNYGIKMEILWKDPNLKLVNTSKTQVGLPQSFIGDTELTVEDKLSEVLSEDFDKITDEAKKEQYKEIEEAKKDLEKKSDYELLDIYYHGDIPEGVKANKNELIYGILQDRFGDEVKYFYKEPASEASVNTGYIETRDGKNLDTIKLKSGEWCYFISKNGIKYAIHNTNGVLRAFKTPSQQQVKLLPDMLKKITVASEEEDEKCNNTSPCELTADSKVTYQDLYNELDEKFKIVKNNLDRIEDRYRYRTINNVSYSLDKAIKLQDDLWNSLDKIDKEISKLWNKIG